jgi:hypothetical protein
MEVLEPSLRWPSAIQHAGAAETKASAVKKFKFLGIASLISEMTIYFACGQLKMRDLPS